MVVPSGTGAPFLVAVARTITAVPASGVTDVAASVSVTLQVPPGFEPPPPPGVVGEVGDSPEHAERRRARPAITARGEARDRRIGLTSSGERRPGIRGTVVIGTS